MSTNLFRLILPIFALAILLSSLGFVTPAAYAHSNDYRTATISGVYPILYTSLDLCSYLTFGLSSCPISLSLNATYNQRVTLQILNTPDLLQPQVQETTAYTITTAQPDIGLTFTFSLGDSSYSYSYPLPTIQVPGTYTITVPLTSILSDIINSLSLGIPIGSLATLFVKLNLPISLNSTIQANLVESGFTPTTGLLKFSNNNVDSYTSTLTGSTNDARVTIQNLAAAFSLTASLDLSFLFTNYQLASTSLPLAMFNSTSNIRAADYYQVQVQSPYGQTTGSGWYLSGTTATISLPSSQTVSSGTTYDFTGWTGTGPASYNGTSTPYTLTITGPVTETANWSQHQFSSPLTAAMLGYAILGVLAIAAVVLIVAVLVLRKSKPHA